MYHPFSVPETLSIAWQLLKKNLATIAVYTLTAFVIIVLTGFIYRNILNNVVLAYTGLIIELFFFSFIFLGFIKLIFQLIDKEYYDFEFKDILPKIKMLFSYVILLIIVSTLAVFVNNWIKHLHGGLVPSILGIFTDLVIEIFFLFYFPICACFIVDEDSGPFESVLQSFRLIRGNFLKYLLLFLIIELLVFIGSITAIGILFAIPFLNIILVVAYRKLVFSRLDVEDDITETI